MQGGPAGCQAEGEPSLRAAPLADLAGTREAILPTSPNRSFWTTSNIALGRFATAIRNAPGVYTGLPQHPSGVAPSALACS